MIQLTGQERLYKALNAMGTQGFVDAAKGPMVAAAGNVLARSKRAAPRMDGTLVNSANLTSKVTSNSIEVSIGYNTPYAHRVHENPRTGHTGGVSPSGRRYKKWAKVGGPNYLKGPVEQSEASFWNEVARGVEAWLRRV